MAQPVPSIMEKIIARNIKKTDPIMAFFIPPSLPRGIPLGFSVRKERFISLIPLDITK